MEQHNVKKSLYVFLTSLLGILLFVTIQRSLALIAVILLNIDYARYSMGTTPEQVHGLNLATLLIAVFFGGWYGVWVGMHWYSYIYEQGKGGWLHGFSGGLFHNQSVAKKVSAPAKSAPAPVSRPAVTVKSKAVSMDSVKRDNRWEFDDLLGRKTSVTVKTREEKVEEEPAPVKRKTRAVKKTTTTRSRAKAKAAA